MNKPKESPAAIDHEIWHRVEIEVSPSAAYQALTELKKLAGWWTSDTRGEEKLGGVLEFWYGNFCQEMRVSALEKDRLVRWQCLDKGMPDWIGSEIEFTITPHKGHCFVFFRHSKWPEITEIFPHCSMSWAVVLLSLKQLLETGKGRPYPDEIKR
jgi:uncharacterized protein YndB with AHSA1/START domain